MVGKGVEWDRVCDTACSQQGGMEEQAVGPSLQGSLAGPHC